MIVEMQGANRTLLHWLKLWDKVVFNRERKVKQKVKVESKKGECCLDVFWLPGLLHVVVLYGWQCGLSVCCVIGSPDWPWGPPSLLYNGYWVFPGGKAAGAWC
jgi:hypothetical protein